MLEKSIDKHEKRVIIETETGERKRKTQMPSQKETHKVISQKGYYEDWLQKAWKVSNV